MLFMYRRIYKEALRQKEAIRRSSVPSQQHLIVDSDSVRSRFQTLQANGFRSASSKKTNTPALQPPIIMTSTAAETPPPQQPTETTALKKAVDSEIIETTTNFNGNSIEQEAVGTPAPPSSPSGPPPPLPMMTKATSTSSSSSPVRTTTLTPATSTLLGTVQRRLSFANTNITEGKTGYESFICRLLTKPGY